MSEKDNLLLTRSVNQNPEALAEYIEIHRWRLMAFIESRLGAALRHKLEPQDIFQEMCADAVRSLPEMNLEGGDPFSWLCQIAERRMKDAHRRFNGFFGPGVHRLRRDSADRPFGRELHHTQSGLPAQRPGAAGAARALATA
jgi:DNA-directed RNA polymerase specialized sigma24 family protein